MGSTGQEISRGALLGAIAMAATVALASCAAGGTSAQTGAGQPIARAAVSASQFVPTQLTPAANVPGDPNHGRALFLSVGCSGCHTITGVTGATGDVGPNLTNVVLRPTIAGEALHSDPDTLVKWIMDPPAMKPGTKMPKLGINENDARDLAAFLYSIPNSPRR